MITDFWIVESGKLVLYKRSGKCVRCGECCKSNLVCRMQVGFVSQSNSGAAVKVEAKAPTAGDWAEREGWSIFLAQGIWWYSKVRREEDEGKACAKLDASLNRCTIWKREQFRPICRYWPSHPEQLAWFPRCGFEFRRGP